MSAENVFAMFTVLCFVFFPGGIDIICRKLSLATSRALHPISGTVSAVIHQLGVKIQKKTNTEKPLLTAAWESDKHLVNFAPFCKSLRTSPQ